MKNLTPPLSLLSNEFFLCYSSDTATEIFALIALEKRTAKLETLISRIELPLYILRFFTGFPIAWITGKLPIV